MELYLLKQPRVRMRVLFKHRCTAPTFIAYGSVWPEIPYDAVFLFTAIMVTLPLFVVKKKSLCPM